MSKNNARVIALAGAAALAGIGYTLGRRSGSRPAARPRASTNPSTTNPSRRVESPLTESALQPAAAARLAQPASHIAELAPDSERISSAPDALDVALDLNGVFDGESDSGVQLTARPNAHLTAPLSRDDDDAPAPEDLGRAWLEQATESEHSLGLADTIPDVENMPKAKLVFDETLDSDEDDETTAEYVRRHRISSAG